MARRDHTDLRARLFHLGDEIGHSRHPIRLAGEKEFPNICRAGCLNIDSVLGQPGGSQHAEKRVVGRFLESGDIDGLALEIGRGRDAGIGVNDELHQTQPAEHRNRAHRYPVAAHNDGSVPHGAADDGVSDADLLGHVGTSARGLELDIEALGRVIAALARNDPRPERRQIDRRR